MFFPNIDDITFLWLVAQLYWNYYSLSGKRYIIQMYHGEDSGHLLLFVNGNILSIDFEQEGGAKKSFMIENQIIELEINEEDEVFEYIVTPQWPKPIESDENFLGKGFWIPLIMVLLSLNLMVYLIKNFSAFG